MKSFSLLYRIGEYGEVRKNAIHVYCWAFPNCLNLSSRKKVCLSVATTRILNREAMVIFHLLLCFWSCVVDLVLVRRMGDREKEIEIMLLRQQLRIVERRQPRGPVL